MGIPMQSTPADPKDYLPEPPKNDGLFEGVAAALGELSSDNRMIASDADLELNFEMPIALTAGFEEAHPMGSRIIGRVSSAWVEDNLLHFEGEFLNGGISDEELVLLKPSVTLGNIKIDTVEFLGSQIVLVAGKLMDIYLGTQPLWPDKVWIRRRS